MGQHPPHHAIAITRQMRERGGGVQSSQNYTTFFDLPQPPGCGCATHSDIVFAAPPGAVFAVVALPPRDLSVILTVR